MEHETRTAAVQPEAPRTPIHRYIYGRPVTTACTCSLHFNTSVEWETIEVGAQQHGLVYGSMCCCTFPSPAIPTYQGEFLHTASIALLLSVVLAFDTLAC